GVVAAHTRLSSVDGHAGELIIGGFPLEELAANATFEETVYLLWHDRLPTLSELERFREALTERRTLPSATVELLHAAAAGGTSVMDALRMAAGTLDLEAPSSGKPSDEAITLVARLPVIV